VKKIGKHVVYGLLICLAVILIPTGLLLLIAQIKTDRFYAERPILRAMNSVHDGKWSNASEPARSVLLKNLFLGTEAESAIAALSRESFGCSKTQDQQNPLQREMQRRVQEIRQKFRGDDVTTKGTWVDCQLLALANFGSTRWIVYFQFDGGNHLVDARVAIWNIFL
jgi:uncharacterized protein (DUF1501 family)